jgi:hypothetical protein
VQAGIDWLAAGALLDSGAEFKRQEWPRRIVSFADGRDQ